MNESRPIAQRHLFLFKQIQKKKIEMEEIRAQILHL